MPLGNREMDRLEDEVLQDRRITSSLYCGNCGYNLKTLPRRYACPECGNEYDTRPPRKGVYSPHDALPPLGMVVWVLVLCIATVSLVLGALSPLDERRLGFGVLFAGLTIWAAYQAYCRIRRFLQFRMLDRRVARQQEEER